AGRYFVSEIVSPRDDHSYHLTSSQVINADNSISNLIVFHDNTEFKKLEDQLYQSRKMESIGTLAGGIAHDFNNIMTAIYGYSELALSRLDEGSEVWHDVYEIKKSGERAANLTRQLLAFSRKQVVVPKKMKVNRLIDEMEKMLSRLISEDIRLTTKLDESIGDIYADPGQFEQVILNLVINARDAVKELPIEVEKVIYISTAMERLNNIDCLSPVSDSASWYLRLEVADNGCGMTKEVQSHIFEPFYTSKSRDLGTGMGLAMIHGIVEQNHGRIEVVSQPDQGAVFKVYWPIMVEDTDTNKEITPDFEFMDYSCNGEVILLVEDDPLIREIGARQLRKAGYTVIAAADGREALEKAAEYKGKGAIDLLFTDVVMPIMGGKELSEKIKTLYPDIITLFATGYSGNGGNQEIIVSDRDHFIEKPYNSRDFMPKINRLLNRKMEKRV
ncbi:MAG: response regulator, partial [Deltaproteobacteria bacterium]|nr:response regulator [Candidatus Tharpella sp.]